MGCRYLLECLDGFVEMPKFQLIWTAIIQKDEEVEVQPFSGIEQILAPA